MSNEKLKELLAAIHEDPGGHGEGELLIGLRRGIAERIGPVRRCRPARDPFLPIGGGSSLRSRRGQRR